MTLQISKELKETAVKQALIIYKKYKLIKPHDLINISEIGETLFNFENEIIKLRQRINEIEQKSNFFTPIVLTKKQKEAIDHYNNFQKWLNNNKLKNENKVIAYIEENDSWKIIAVADSKEAVYKKLKELFRENPNLKKTAVRFHNYGENLGFFKY
ncbi:MAG: hypothetical protein ACTSR3_21390 [Candidatus Helarchaeota archaeon]